MTDPIPISCASTTLSDETVVEEGSRAINHGDEVEIVDVSPSGDTVRIEFVATTRELTLSTHEIEQFRDCWTFF